MLPDYQGIGIGRAFLDAVAELYVSQGHMFEIKTSARNLIGSLRNHPSSRFAEGGASWRAASWGFSHKVSGSGISAMNGTVRTNAKTATFLYDGAGCLPFEGGWRPNSYGFSSGDANSGRLRYKERSQCKTATFMFERADG